MSRPAKRHRDAGTGHFVSPEFAKAHPQTTVAERERAARSCEAPVTFKKGDRIDHPSVGKATVTSGRLGPNGELKVKPDEPHHSGLPVVEVMARRAAKIEKE